MDKHQATPTVVAIASPHHRKRDVRSFWTWVLALAAPIPFLALAANIWLLPSDLRADLPAQLLGVAAHPDPMQAALWLSLVFAVSAVPAVIAVAWSSRRDAPWLSLIGGVIGIVAFAEAGVGAHTDLLAVIGVTEHLGTSQIVSVNDGVTEHPAGQIGMLVFLIGQAVSLILLGIAMWRTHLAPRWMGILLAVSGPAHLLTPGGNVGAATSWLLTAVGCVGASIALLRTSNDAFDLPPETAPQLQEHENPSPPTHSLRTRTS